MRHTRRWIGGAIVGLMALKALGGVNANRENHYQRIPERNAFGLKERPEQLKEPVKPVPVLPKISLTGIATVLGYKMAMFRVQFPAKPGEVAREESLTVVEGQRAGVIEVISIDEKAKRVRVNNSGTVMPLTFDQDGLRALEGKKT